MYFLGIDHTATHYPGVWIVIPAFNEAAVIGDVIADVRTVFANVVCVDDGSTDGTGPVARRAGAYLVSHPVNLGQGASIQTGVAFARGRPGAEVFVTFDADGQHRVEDAVRMVDRLGAGDLDIVVGTRFGGTETPERTPWRKRLVLRTAVRLSPRIRRLGLSDAHNGLRAFNRRVADGLDITMNGMSHAGELLALIDENHWRVGEVPVRVRYTAYSKAKGQPLLNGVNIVFDGLLRNRMSR